MTDQIPECPLLQLYQLISGPAAQERDWDAIRRLFLPDARIRLTGKQEDGTERTADWSVEEFAGEASTHYRRSGFWEREIARRTEHFGNIAHVFSAYESRVGSPDDPPVARGINSVQLICRRGRWLIAGIVFQIEVSGKPIPARYLQPDDGQRET